MRPAVKEFEDFKFKLPCLVSTERGIPLYVYESKGLNVCRVDIIFSAGTYQQSMPLETEAAAEAMTEASEKRSSAAISELFDFYGGFIQKGVSTHYTIFTLYAPNRTFPKLLPLFFEVITSPRFSKRDLDRFKQRGSESLKVAQKKVENISYKIFKEKMFGSHPYGVTPCVEDYDNLNTDSIRSYAKEYFVAERCSVVMSGDINDKMIELLSQNILRIPSGTVQNKHYPVTSPHMKGVEVKEIANVMQSSVRIGAFTINRQDENYLNLYILNTAMGGYFGSRFNKTIREEKGYTYGINSWLIGLPDTAYLSISTHTAVHFTKPLLQEVKNEIDKIKSSPISDEELQQLRGYMLGDFARMFDTSFTLADNFIALLTNNIGFDYFDKRVEAIKSITPEILLTTAQNFLPCYDDMCIVVAGGIK
ncbi:MAG: insulinase family protein [Bacteroidales bacterium]|nr:insulinase family protein [Bacteroidales bacterium]